MQPVKFPQKNFTYTAPSDMPDCGDLPCYRIAAQAGTPPQAISCWKASFWERVKILFLGRVWLTMLQSSHPPVELSLTNPFPKPTKEAK
jgi:hypothetical protein